MTHRTFDEQIANFNRVVSSWDINQEYKVVLLGMIASLGYEHEKSITPEPHWIPCSERLPNKEGEYLVTDDAGGVKTVEVDTLLHYEDDGKPFWCYSQNPIAWCELPEPYKGVSK